MTKKRILSLVLALMMVLTMLPVALAETQPDVVYGYTEGGIDFYACDQAGNPDFKTPVDPNTITHLYLAPEGFTSYIDVLRMDDYTTLQWVTVLDPMNVGVNLDQKAFAGYQNLSQVNLPQQVTRLGDHLLKGTAVRSFTLPQGDVDYNLLAGCSTVGEIVNPTENDVTLLVHGKDVTIPAGETWEAEFGVKFSAFYGAPGANFTYPLRAFGVNDDYPVVWSASNLPAGFTLTEDGILTGQYPATDGDSLGINVTVTNGDNTVRYSLQLIASKAIDVTVVLPDGVTLVDGPEGEESLDVYAPASFTFELSDAVAAQKTLRDARIKVIFENGESDSWWDYTLRGNTVYLSAEALSGVATLVVEPVFSVDDALAVASATPLTFPYEDTITDYTDVYFADWNQYYASKVYKVDLTAGQMVDFTFFNPEDDEVDTSVVVITQSESDEYFIEDSWWFDGDSVGSWGESGSFIATQDDTYYFFLCTYYDTPVGCRFTATLSESQLPIDAHLTQCLDFTDADELPQPDDDGCWTWDAATKTLTLMDGFEMWVDDDIAIFLPSDATVKVDGKATIAAMYEAIYVEADNLTFELGEKADLTLISFEEEAIELEGGLLKINGKNGTSKLTAYAYGSDAIVVGDWLGYVPGTDITVAGEIQISDTVLMIECSNDALQSTAGNITLNNCQVTINTNSDGFICDWGESADVLISLTDCTVTAVCDSEVFDIVDGNVALINCDVRASGYMIFDVWNEVTVEGGRLVAIAESEVIWFNDVTNENTRLSVTDASYYFYGETFTNATTIELDGTMEMLDADKNLLYRGQWDTDRYDQFRCDEDLANPAILRSVYTGTLTYNDCGVTDKTYLINDNQIILEPVGSIPEYYVDGTWGWIPQWVTVNGEQVPVSGEDSFTCILQLPETFEGDSVEVEITYVLCEYTEGQGWLPRVDFEGYAQSITKSFTVAVEKAAAYGDVNKDGSVDAGDALMVLKYAVNKLELTAGEQIAADVNGDGAINAGDALDILKYAVGKIKQFDVEK